MIGRRPVPYVPSSSSSAADRDDYSSHHETADWLRGQRDDLRARANALRRAGEIERADILKSIVDPEIRRLLVTAPLPDLAKAGAPFRDRLPPAVMTRLKKVPWGYRETDLTALGAVSMHPEPVIDFQESPTLSRRIGRRAKCSDWLATLSGEDVYFGVATCPEPVPHFGDLREALNKHLSAIRKASAAVQISGFYLLFRSTELTVNRAHVHIHSNLLWLGPKSQFPTSIIKDTIGARYHNSGHPYNMPALAKYLTKTPITASRGIADNFKLLYEPAMIHWLHSHLSRRRLIEYGRRRPPSKEEVAADPFEAAPNDQFAVASTGRVPDHLADSGNSGATGQQGVPGGLIASRSIGPMAPNARWGGQKSQGRVTDAHDASRSAPADEPPVSCPPKDLVDSGDTGTTERQSVSGGLIASHSAGPMGSNLPLQGHTYTPLPPVENVIVTIRPAAPHSSGRTEPIIIIRAYTRYPKTASGRAGLQEILSIHRDEAAKSSSATAAATYLDDRTAIINKRSPYATEARWEIQHVYDEKQVEWKFGPVEIDDDDDDDDHDDHELWFNHVDLSILDQPTFDPGDPPADPDLLPGWHRSVERRRNLHESEIAHARAAARAKWDYSIGSY